MSSAHRIEVIGWWDANSLIAHTDGSNIVSPVSANSWPDSGPLGRGLRQPQSSLIHAPSVILGGTSTIKFYKTTAGKLSDSGLPSVECAGHSGASRLETTLNIKQSNAPKQDFTVFLCCKPVSVSAGANQDCYIYSLHTTTAVQGDYAINFSNNKGKVVYSLAGWTGHGTMAEVASAGNNPATKQFLFSRVYKNAVCPLYVNGVNIGNVTQTGYPTGTMTFSWGSYVINAGGTGYVTLYFEMIVINREVADAERQMIEGYLAHKWWAPGNIPLDPSHPYFAAPPGNGSFDFVYVQQTNQ